MAGEGWAEGALSPPGAGDRGAAGASPSAARRTHSQPSVSGSLGPAPGRERAVWSAVGPASMPHLPRGSALPWRPRAARTRGPGEATLVGSPEVSQLVQVLLPQVWGRPALCLVCSLPSQPHWQPFAGWRRGCSARAAGSTLGRRLRVCLCLFREKWPERALRGRPCQVLWPPLRSPQPRSQRPDFLGPRRGGRQTQPAWTFRPLRVPDAPFCPRIPCDV